ncbi:MAG: flagellar FlbD family protein [Deltaproteobacteria bacterium]|nr:flagellar FlbD family protein [Deltaproteobacteria bacterium]
MIALTRMDKQLMYLNPDHIISIEETPDTVITLFNGNHYIVMERADSIISRVVAFRSRVIRRAQNSNRRYLLRQRKSLFQRVALANEAACPATRNAHDRTPFHSRDY